MRVPADIQIHEWQPDRDGAASLEDDVRMLGRVFRDEEELGALSDLSARIDAALAGSRWNQ